MGDAGTSHRCFTEVTPEAAIHIQVADLGRQVYVWISTGAPKLSNLSFAIQGLAAALPSVATLIPGSAASDANSLSQRLAAKLGRPVMCSCNLPSSDPTLQAIAERRLLRELSDMGLTRA